MTEQKAPGKALYFAAVLVGIIIAIAIIYEFWLAVVTNPKDPWSVFPISRFFTQFTDAVFYVGAVVWLIGTAVFLLELAGFTITGRGLKRTGQGIGDWGVIDIALAALSAAVYGALLAATAPITIVPGFTWLRPANSLAPLFGMFFGIPGALGAAFGNLIADILAGYFGVGSIGGFVGNFLIAYIPYKFVKDQSFKTTSSIGEFYIWGVIVQALVSALYICWWLHVTQALIGLPLFVIWGIIAPSILSNNIAVNAILSPILGVLLFPFVKGRGLYWKDRVKAPQ
ncbi:QueT transporter family protein [Infirmifilum lucidum]|uniref:QueT transporter family protein n=1 Tax=Infirmifilum lucidum TaxID=2776706 RepID=A0A7L9FIF8_9CREN|nr:QueT transporter family protein [Infirmifilum lucidum]QOJ79411.1 QueT transporter family protein [Infirmifilum lucidum]